MTNILTLRVDPISQAHFDQMRQRYFPPERNLIPAHLTLFHTLPDTPEISNDLHSAAGSIQPFPMQVTGLRSLGRGVAYTLVSLELQALHRRLSSAFELHLSPQDRQKFQPHIVIQNKATPEQARTLMALLQPAFQPFDVHVEGLDLWHYRGGPWEHTQTFPFGCT